MGYQIKPMTKIIHDKQNRTETNKYSKQTPQIRKRVNNSVRFGRRRA